METEEDGGKGVRSKGSIIVRKGEDCNDSVVRGGDCNDPVLLVRGGEDCNDRVIAAVAVVQQQQLHPSFPEALHIFAKKSTAPLLSFQEKLDLR